MGILEKLFRIFIRKMIYLSNNTSNYILYLETDLNFLHSSTLTTHFSYINKVLRLSEQRLPDILAEKTIELNITWAKEWSNICQLIQYCY